MSLGLETEVASKGIRVNVVRCGVIDTEIHAGHGEDRLEALLSKVPMRRMGDARRGRRRCCLSIGPRRFLCHGLDDRRGGRTIT